MASLHVCRFIIRQIVKEVFSAIGLPENGLIGSSHVQHFRVLSAGRTNLFVLMSTGIPTWSISAAVAGLADPVQAEEIQ
jgi:hypothetical protein